MQISVLVEPVPGNGYRAKGAEAFGFSAQGATREEAIDRGVRAERTGGKSWRCLN